MDTRLENAVNRLVKFLVKKEFCREAVEERSYTHYWNNEGKYESEYKKLYEELIPKRYGCSEESSECLRLLSRAYYRKYNDGDKVNEEVYRMVKKVIKEG